MTWPDLHSSQSFWLLSCEKSGLKGEKWNKWKDIRWKPSEESRQDPRAHRERMTMGLQGGERLKDARETERCPMIWWFMRCRRWEKEKSCQSLGCGRSNWEGGGATPQSKELAERRQCGKESEGFHFMHNKLEMLVKRPMRDISRQLDTHALRIRSKIWARNTVLE